MASQYNMDDQYNMEDIHSALNAICPGSASGLDANSSFDLNLYLERLPDIPLFCDGEGAAGGVNGPPEAASASGYSAQSHLAVEGSAFGYNQESHLPLEESVPSWERQSHLPREGSVPSWERQSQLVPEGSASGWGASSHLGLGEAPSPTWQHNDYLRMVDPNEVLRTPATEDHQLSQGPQLLPHDPTALHYPSTTLNSSTDSSECCLFPQDDMSREQHSVYPQESEHSAYSPGTLSGATASPYSSNLPAGTPPLRSSSSALEADLGARHATRKGYHHRVTRKFLPDGEEKERRKQDLNNVASKDYRENKKMTEKKMQKLLEEQLKRQQQLTLKYQVLKDHHHWCREMWKAHFSEQVPDTPYLQVPEYNI